MIPAAMLHALAERTNLLVFAYDLGSGHFTYVNSAFTSFFGLEEGELQSDTLLGTVHPEDQEYITSKFKALLAEKTVQDVECRFVKGGNERWLRIDPFFSGEEGTDLVMGYAEDITLFKQHSKNLNDHNHKKNSILTIMAHDLAGPIGTVHNIAELLTRETAKLKNERVDEYIGMIKKLSKSSIGLIRNFLNREFLETSNVQLLKGRVELTGRIKILIEEYLAMPKNVKVNFHCQANKEAIYVEIDEDKFLQVINNLISNALKFTPDGGTITTNIEQNDGGTMISVADTGVGIPEEHHAALFDKFSNARRSGLHGEASTGLGMYIIKTIVEWHEGKIWFESEEGKGTTFYIQLPK